MKITVLGAGSWGTALALLLSKQNEVTIYTNSTEQADTINNDGENKEFLPGVMLPKGMKVITDPQKAVDAELVVIAVPSHVVKIVLEDIAKFAKSGTIFVNVSKGLEESSLRRISEVMEELLPSTCEIAVLSGPSHAEEVSRDIPTAVVAASKNEETAKKVQDIFMQPSFRVYTSTDLVGVELGGAVKNVIALAAGIVDGLGYGDNTKAALMTRGMSEMARLGIKMGGSRDTFAGLAGMGDLIVTCTSMHSRNRRAGILLGKGKSLDETLKEVHMVVEGVYSAKSVYALAQKYGVDMPISEEINKVLFEGKDPNIVISDLMGRDKKGE